MSSVSNTPGTSRRITIASANRADSTELRVDKAGDVFIRQSEGELKLRRQEGPVRLNGQNVAVSDSSVAQSASFAESPDGATLRILQLETQIVPAFRRVLENMGVELHQFLGSQAFAATIPSDVLAKVHALPFVRGTAEYGEGLKIPAGAMTKLEKLASTPGLKPRRHDFIVKAPSPEAATAFKQELAVLRGQSALRAEKHEGAGTFFSASLTPQECLALLSSPNVLWMEPATEAGIDMNIGREAAGLDELQYPEGADADPRFTGQGLKIHVLEGIEKTHQEFKNEPIDVMDGSSSSHGHATAGIIASQGLKEGYKGAVPDAQLLYTAYGAVNNQPDARMRLTKELVEKYDIDLQTASWGNSRTPSYTAISAALDEILFMYRQVVVTQSQSNAGNSQSRPQSWAKNVVAGLAFKHRDTLDRADDAHDGGGSTRDGDEHRIGRSFSAYYDYIRSTGLNGGYTDTFGGTSGATPMINGFLATIVQMFKEGHFTDSLNSAESVGESGRAQSATVAAMAIVSAHRYQFEGPQADMRRAAQGWGFPQPKKLFDSRDKMFVVNEEHRLRPLETMSYDLEVTDDEPELNLSMVYVDPPAAPGAAKTQINDLDLKLTAPDGTMYLGNVGLFDGNESAPGGEADTTDTVENIFIRNPMPGTWKAEVIAREINQDAIPATPDVDVNYALAVLGAKGQVSK